MKFENQWKMKPNKDNATNKKIKNYGKQQQ